MRHTQSQSRSFWSNYAKAAAVFTLTTATYLLARTTGWLPPGWLGGEKLADDSESTTALSMSSTEESSLIPLLTKESKGDFELQSSISTDFQAIESTDLSLTEEDSSKIKIPSTQWRLLQQSQVIVANPVPDQLIEMGKPYQYSLDNVFSGNYTFLTVEQINHQPLPGWLSVQYMQLATVAGTFYDVAVNGSTLFLPDYLSGLKIVDITNASTPRILSTLANPNGGNANGIAISGNVAFIAAEKAGLQIVDISNLSSPRSLSLVANSLNGTAQDVAVSGATAFVADGLGGLQIVDVSNLTAPRVLSTVASSLYGDAQGVAVSGSIVFVADQLGGLQIVDATNLSAPRILSVVGIYAVDVAVSDNIVFVADILTGLQIVDASNLTAPRVLSTVANSPNGDSEGVALSGSIVFVGDGLAGSQIIDVSHLMSPRILATVANNFGGLRASGAAISGSLVFLADWYSGLQIIDISQCSLVGVPPVTPTGQELVLVVSAGDTSIKFSTDTFVLTIDQLPRLPIRTVADQSIFPGQFKIVPLRSDALFVNPRSSFLQLAVTLLNGGAKPVWFDLIMTPVIVNIFTNSLAYGLSVSGNTVFVAGGNAGLQILDIQNLNAPRVLSTVPNGPNGYAVGVIVSGSTVFMADDAGGLQIIDVTNLGTPRVISTMPNNSGGYAQGVAVSGSTVFVADYTAGLQIIDVTNLTMPRVLSIVPNSPGGVSYDVAVSDNTVFVANGNAGLQIVDVTNLSVPRVLSTVSNSPSVARLMEL